MESVPSETPRDPEPDQDFRVRLTSKRRAAELMSACAEVLRGALDEQPKLSEETRRVLLQELLANFEAGVHLNVSVDGQTWDEAPDLHDEEALDLEGLLDDAILEASSRRRSYPKRILPHVVHALKAERKILGLFDGSVRPDDLQKDPEQGKIMQDLSAAAPGMVKQAIQVIKAIGALRQQAEGLCEILHMKPSAASLQIHREVLGPAGVPEGGAVRSRRPVKRAVEDASEGYVCDAKRPELSVLVAEAE